MLRSAGPPRLASDALASAEKERTAAGPPGAEDSPSNEDAPSNHNSEVSDHRDLYQALFLHEAAVIANLHAQAVAVQNIRALVSSTSTLATTIVGVINSSPLRSTPCRITF